MAKLTIWYSIQSGGDGSAHPRWFESRELTEMDQDLMEDGWGERCNGSIIIEGENMSVVRPRIITKEEFVKNTLEQIINSNYHGRATKRKAMEYRDKLIPPQPREFDREDPFGEEKIVEIKKFKDI